MIDNFLECFVLFFLSLSKYIVTFISFLHPTHYRLNLRQLLHLANVPCQQSSN